MRLPVVHGDELNPEEITLYLLRNGRIEKFVCNEAGQRQVLQDIYRHTFEGPVSLDKVIQEHLTREIEKRPPLKECGKWWAQILQSFRLNTVGYMLGYAYGKQIFEDFPDWI